MSVKTTVVKLYTDGACSCNPGPGAIGIVVLDENDQELWSSGEPIGDTTNNRAEYHALIKGLETVCGICRRKVICYSDSQLMIKQLNGQYRIRNPELRELCIKAKSLTQLFNEVVFQHTPRQNQYITKADGLASRALSGQ